MNIKEAWGNAPRWLSTGLTSIARKDTGAYGGKTSDPLKAARSISVGLAKYNWSGGIDLSHANVTEAPVPKPKDAIYTDESILSFFGFPNGQVYIRDASEKDSYNGIESFKSNILDYFDPASKEYAQCQTFLNKVYPFKYFSPTQLSKLANNFAYIDKADIGSTEDKKLSRLKNAEDDSKHLTRVDYKHQNANTNYDKSGYDIDRAKREIGIRLARFKASNWASQFEAKKSIVDDLYNEFKVKYSGNSTVWIKDRTKTIALRRLIDEFSEFYNYLDTMTNKVSSNYEAGIDIVSDVQRTVTTSDKYINQLQVCANTLYGTRKLRYANFIYESLNINEAWGNAPKWLADGLTKIKERRVRTYSRSRSEYQPEYKLGATSRYKYSGVDWKIKYHAPNAPTARALSDATFIEAQMPTNIKDPILKDNTKILCFGFPNGQVYLKDLSSADTSDVNGDTLISLTVDELKDIYSNKGAKFDENAFEKLAVDKYLYAAGVVAYDIPFKKLSNSQLLILADKFAYVDTTSLPYAQEKTNSRIDANIEDSTSWKLDRFRHNLGKRNTWSSYDSYTNESPIMNYYGNGSIIAGSPDLDKSGYNLKMFRAELYDRLKEYKRNKPKDTYVNDSINKLDQMYEFLDNLLINSDYVSNKSVNSKASITDILSNIENFESYTNALIEETKKPKFENTWILEYLQELWKDWVKLTAPIELTNQTTNIKKLDFIY